MAEDADILQGFIENQPAPGSRVRGPDVLAVLYPPGSIPQRVPARQRCGLEANVFGIVLGDGKTDRQSQCDNKCSPIQGCGGHRQIPHLNLYQ